MIEVMYKLKVKLCYKMKVNLVTKGKNLLGKKTLMKISKGVKKKPETAKEPEFYDQLCGSSLSQVFCS